MSFDLIGNFLLYFWLVILICNHLVFKSFVLREIKKNHFNLWEKLGRPKAFSMKESMWSLIGLSGQIDIPKYLEKEQGSESILILLERYKWSVYFEFVLLFIWLFGLLIYEKT